MVALGGMTGVEVLEHMINKANEHGSAFDPNTGYNYSPADI